MQRSDSQYADAVQLGGWQHQANHITAFHTMVGRATSILAKKVRRLSPLQRATSSNPTSDAEFERGLEAGKSEFANELAQAPTKLAERDAAPIQANQWVDYLAERGVELEHQVAGEAPAARIPEERVEAPTEQSVVTNKRVAELEGEVATAHEKLIVCRNENCSLQTSLNWIISENVRLSHRLTELEAAIGEVNQKRQSETDALSTRLKAMSTRALAAETLLEEMWRRLLAGTREKRGAGRDQTPARDIVDNNLQQLRNSLTIELPTALTNTPDTRVDFVKIWEKLMALDLRLRSVLDKHVLAAPAREKLRTNYAELCDEWADNAECNNGRRSERAEVRRTQILLANILASKNATRTC